MNPRDLETGKRYQVTTTDGIYGYIHMAHHESGIRGEYGAIPLPALFLYSEILTVEEI